MKPAPALLLYLLLIFCSAAVFSPAAYHFLGGSIPAPFHRYVDRLLMVSALFWMGFFWRNFGLNSWEDLNIHWRKLPRGIAGGALLGVLIALLVFGLMLMTQSRHWTGLPPLFSIPGWVIGLVVLAFLEELLFRGLALTVFIRQWGLAGGVTASVLLFAFMHFIKVPADFQPDPVLLSSGWRAVGMSFMPLFHGGWLGGYFVVLVLLGVVLSLSVLLYRSLGPAIGLHAGLIIGQHFIEVCSQPVDRGGIMGQPLNSHPFTQVLLVLLIMVMLALYVKNRYRGEDI